MAAVKKIMVVDDEPAILASTKTVLELSGYQVIEAHSGSDCLVKIKQGNIPDLILLDMMLPDLNGFQVFEKVKGEIGLKNTKMIAFTALASKEAIDKITAMGFDSYFPKPFSPRELIARVKEVLARP
jgi:DNA-binding response OmpR family regulator